MPLNIIALPDPGPTAACEASLVLVRPDQYVAWIGHDEACEPEAILRRAVGH